MYGTIPLRRVDINMELWMISCFLHLHTLSEVFTVYVLYTKNEYMYRMLHLLALVSSCSCLSDTDITVIW